MLSKKEIKRAKNSDLYKLLQLNGRLQKLGDELVTAIQNHAHFKDHKSANMELAIANWKTELEANYTKVPE